MRVLYAVFIRTEDKKQNVDCFGMIYNVKLTWHRQRETLIQSSMMKCRFGCRQKSYIILKSATILW